MHFRFVLLLTNSSWICSSHVLMEVFTLGHYSYECTSAQQERPYVSRPSRTQQLLNPKLAPKITEAALDIAIPKDEKRKRGLEALKEKPKKRSRSASYSSGSISDSDSVSTVSTNRSRSASRSPPRRRRSPANDKPPAPRTQRKDERATRSSRSRSPRGSPVSRRGARHDRSRSPFREARDRSSSPYTKRLAIGRS
jgi:hypothetical protein